MLRSTKRNNSKIYGKQDFGWRFHRLSPTEEQKNGEYSRAIIIIKHPNK